MALQDDLRDLFLLDKQVRGMRSRLDAALRRTQAQQTKREQFKQQHEELTAQLRQAQAHAAGLEEQSGGIEERIEKLRQQMTTVTSDKEYKALSLEVNTLKTDKSAIEDQALEQMSQVDELKQRVADLERKLEERSKMESVSASEVESAREEVGDKLAEVEVKRDEAAKNIPDDVLATFNRLADNYEGEAMAEIEEQDRRRMEYTCGGCFMSLPVERVNAVMTKTDQVTTCPNCNRILYMSKELKESIGAG